MMKEIANLENLTVRIRARELAYISPSSIFGPLDFTKLQTPKSWRVRCDTNGG